MHRMSFSAVLSHLQTSELQSVPGCKGRAWARASSSIRGISVLPLWTGCITQGQKSHLDLIFHAFEGHLTNNSVLQFNTRKAFYFTFISSVTFNSGAK